jgi:preprotein translocase subunit SecE
MSSEAQENSGNLDTFKWGIVVLLLVAGVGADYYLSEVARALKLAGWIFLIGAIGAIALNTVKGQLLLEFAKEARTELRKVVWPTRQETVQSTMMVIAMVFIMAIILWTVDSLLMWLITKFTA